MRLSDWIRRIEHRLLGPADRAATMEQRIRTLRRRGVRIGEGCQILTSSFSTEPYLVDIGHRVAIAGGVKFITHDGSAWLARRERPHAQVLGRIRVGDDTYIAEDCLILPGTTIGAGCVIAAGSVVRGGVPDNSIVIGNPGRIVGRASLLPGCHAALGRVLETLHLPESERERVIRHHFGV